MSNSADPRTDIDLMTALQSGDQDALAVLIRRYQPGLVNFFRRMGASIVATEDLVQETFLRLFRYREKYRPTGRFVGLLFVMARHALADAQRASMRDERNIRERAATTDMAAFDRTAVRMDMQEALAGLSEKLRIVVVLNAYQGMKLQEIADVLDIPVGTVKSRLHLAMNRLSDILGGDYGTE
ncbi:MAG: sigma-70 family RNA polymerase sigma factor [Planctomycetota bacterium]